MTFTLELSEDMLQSLQAEAERQHVPLQELIVLKLQQDISSATSSTRSETLGEEAFSKLARGIVEDYRVVLERLA